MGFPRQEYWNGLPFSSPSRGSSWPRDWTWVSCVASRFFTPEPPGKPPGEYNMGQIWETMLVSKSLKLFAISQTSLVLSLLRNLTYPFFISPTSPSSAFRKGPCNFFQHVSLSLVWFFFFFFLPTARNHFFPEGLVKFLQGRQARRLVSAESLKDASKFWCFDQFL